MSYSSGFRDAWNQTAESVREMTVSNDRLRARVDELTVVLIKIGKNGCENPGEDWDCSTDYVDSDDWCAPCAARAATRQLAA